MFRILGNAIKFVNSIEKILLYLRRIGNSIGILAFGAVKPTNGGYQTRLVTKRLVISKRVIYILMFSVLSVFRKDYGCDRFRYTRTFSLPENSKVTFPEEFKICTELETLGST